MGNNTLRQKDVVTSTDSELQESVLLSDESLMKVLSSFQIGHWKGYLITIYSSEK